MDFDQFRSPNTSGSSSSTEASETIIALFHVIKHRQKPGNKHQDDGCKFCSLLFDAISIHDPFEHPAIIDHMPDDLPDKSFKILAEGGTIDKLLKKGNPFCESLNHIDERATESDPSAILDSTKEALKKHKLPVVVTISIHNNTQEDGAFLHVSVVGFGKEAPLSVLSSFILRIASDYQKYGLSLTYGKILTDKVNVEADCRKWMDHCRGSHGHDCAKPDWSTRLPPPAGEDFRLVEINQLDDRFRVLQAENISRDLSRREEDTLEYAALSYVWGEFGSKTLHLRELGIEALGRWTSSDQLGKTVKDAMEVTKRLGMRYLWVDSLCVVQGDRRGERASPRQKSQITQMDSIYGHASVTIVAAAGEDANAGLAGVSSSREAQQVAREVKGDINILLPVEYDASYGKWDARGWTLQEKLLSKRMLVFGETFASFHCRHGVLREDMPAVHAGNGPAPMPLLSMPSCSPGPIEKNWQGDPVLLRSPFFDQYAKLLEQYTSRNMTNSTDILDGVLGLLSVLEDMRSTEPRKKESHTLYGLPEDYLDLALLWQPPADSGTYLTQRMQSTYPSWSWAGWEVNKGPPGGNVYQDSPGVRMEETFRVSGNDDCSLRKFLATGNAAEERVKPLVMWYKWVEQPERSQRRSWLGKGSPPLLSGGGPKAEPSRAPPLPPGRPKSGTIRAPPVPSKPITLKSPEQARFPDLARIPERAKSPEPTGKLVPVNGHGLGMAFGDRDSTIQLEFLQRARQWRNPRGNPDADPGPPQVPDGAPLKDRHLVCETAAASFRLRGKEPREEHLWERGAGGEAFKAKTLLIKEAEILDDADNVVGYVVPTDQGKDIATPAYDFVLLSEAQYWGNDPRIDIAGFPLYNVMVVVWDEDGLFAKRVGMGKISKVAWHAGNPTMKCVVLK
ncbi:hypothetical protein PG985_007588 [Apiospora marii]|uniref:uncharacterized protein n=1 Tax=Apiospora marii TaxID=335849 RepID=UPI0031316900